ncbi:hypothetical protein MINTM005_29410 [Mycobacterium intracellulare]|nr:hypothetical protein MINTM005_29410 [Mycobacterium intracellulare]BCO94862.1 hypothetical protein MINTM016_28380 [Mycobacterium intracellulare]
MVGLGQIALDSAPVFGGVMLAVAAGQFKGPDYRGMIKQDMDLLDRLPTDATDRRADLQRTIDARIDDMVEAADRSRALRRAALSYQGNWRDVVLLLCGVVHHRLVEREPCQKQLAAHVHSVDRPVVGRRRLRVPRGAACGECVRP